MFKYLDIVLIYVMGYLTYYMYENRSKDIFILWCLLAFVLLILIMGHFEYITVKQISNNVEKELNKLNEKEDNK